MLKLPYGLLKEENIEKLVHISEIQPHESGLRCNCVCPKCGERLQAKLPRTKKDFTPRFVHHRAITCDYAAETAIHMKAKEIIEKEKHLFLPELVVEYKGLRKEAFPYKKVDFDHVKLEHRMNNIIPDIVAYKKNIPLIIEIKITHAIDYVKSNKIETLEISAIEIDLSYLKTNFDPNSLYEEIISNTKNKKWVYHRKKKENEEKLKRIYNKRNEEKQLKQKKAEYLRKQIEKDNMKRRKAELDKTKLLQDETFQIKLKETWSKGFHKHHLWIRATARRNISIENIPSYINIDVPRDIVFGCDRRIWQAYIFDRFVDNSGRSYRPNNITLTEIYDDIIFDFKSILIKDLIYDRFEYKDIYKNVLREVIHLYLKKLEELGYLKEQYYGVFKILFSEDSIDE
ncbi:MAG: hypothetical protein Q8T08_21610 [Ignavibacteria bacterium]|nr:hypothetical protein [Ignavibacteria bacterium]